MGLSPDFLLQRRTKRRKWGKGKSRVTNSGGKKSNASAAQPTWPIGRGDKNKYEKFEKLKNGKIS